MSRAETVVPGTIRALALFFAVGALASCVAAITLLIPQSPLERIWRLNPNGHRGLQVLGPWGIFLMGAVSLACASTARGLWTRAWWARWLALGILTVNLAGDTVTAVLQHDARTLIGIPIGGTLIGYLLSSRVRRLFAAERLEAPRTPG